ncbi:MAG: RNA polymerase sigma factor [Planctomycetes bacterium]|nr:RNA polymerase sigma factor [Planctomycetota bacterium]
MLRTRDDSPQDRSGVDDLELVQRTLRDDLAARRELIGRLGCVERMLRSLHRRFGSPLRQADLDDLVQETLVKIWERRSTFEGRGALESWVYRFCYLGLIGQARRIRREAVHQSPLDSASFASAPVEEERLDIAPRDLEFLEQGLGELRSEEAEVISLRHFESSSFSEIAARLSVPLSTCKSHYYRGLARLRRYLRRRRQEGDRG